MAEEAKKVTQEQEWDEPEQEEQKDTNGQSKQVDQKTFTQDHLNRMMTREKTQGRNSVYKELGIDPENTKMIDMLKAIISSQKSDDVKNLESKIDIDSKLAEAQRRALIAETKAEAMQNGVQKQYVDDLVTLVLSKSSEDNDVKTLIGEFKTKYPVWFEEQKEDDKKKDTKKVGQKGTGSTMNSKSDTTTAKDQGIGARLAAKRSNANNKTERKSYWNSK